MNEPVEAEFTVERTPHLDALAAVPIRGALVIGLVAFLLPLVSFWFDPSPLASSDAPWRRAFATGLVMTVASGYLLRWTIHSMGYRGPKWNWMEKYTLAFLLICLALAITRAERVDVPTSWCYSARGPEGLSTAGPCSPTAVPSAAPAD